MVFLFLLGIKIYREPTEHTQNMTKFTLPGVVFVQPVSCACSTMTQPTAKQPFDKLRSFSRQEKHTPLPRRLVMLPFPYLFVPAGTLSLESRRTHLCSV